MAADSGLTKTLHTAVYVGPVDRESVLVQSGSKLCMLNLALLGKECAYQRMLRSFGAVATITIEPLCLEELLRLGILDPRSGYEGKDAKEEIDLLVERFSKLLSERADMLSEYVSLVIKDKKLCALPNALGVPSATG